MAGEFTAGLEELLPPPPQDSDGNPELEEKREHAQGSGTPSRHLMFALLHQENAQPCMESNLALHGDGQPAGF